MATIEMRKRMVVNNDPQRRCYNGCHYSTEVVWTGWESLESGIAEDKMEERLEFWRWLSDYAATERKEPVGTEYRVKATPA